MKSTRVAGFLASILAIAVLAGSATAAPAKKKAKAAKAPKAVPESLQVLVWVGKDGITRGEVDRRIESLPEQFRASYTTPEGRQQLLDRMVEERVWLALAVENGVAKRPQVAQQLEQQRRDLLVRTYLNEVMAENPAPSDSEAMAYYQDHLSEYRVPATVTVRHIQSKTQKESQKVRQWLKNPKQDFAALAKKYSTDSLTRNDGGVLGVVTREGVFRSIGAQPALAESAFALPEGALGGPYKTDKGWHVIKIDAVKEESVRPFDQVRPMILRQLGSTRSQDFYRTKLEDARIKLGVRPDSAVIRNFVSQQKGARELFNEAQALAAPEARLEAYRALLAQYPDSEVSAQAQFMIGFIYSEEIKNYDEAEKAFRQLLARYPQAELAPSAQWMIDHMREESAPAFINLDASDGAEAGGKATRPKPWTPGPKGSTSGKGGKDKGASP